jgi:hypothetical protein
VSQESQIGLPSSVLPPFGARSTAFFDLSDSFSDSVVPGCAVQWSAGDIDERGWLCSVSGAVVVQLGEMGALVWEASGGVVTAVGGASRHARRALSRAATFPAS